MALFPHSWTLDEILALSLTPKMRAVDMRHLVQEYASLSSLLHAAPPEIRKARLAEAFEGQNGLFGKHLSPADVYDALMTDAHKQQTICRTEEVHIVSYWDNAYPALLKTIYYPPVLLYVRGRLNAPEAKALAIVGTRHCTDYGRMVAEQYAQRFAEVGITVVSGLATGIDTFAHKAALQAGGSTYSVIASGIDCISPQSAEKLAREIASNNGAVVSEYPCGTVAQRGYFPQRNRIIAGIASGVLVVESGEKGGSLITARFALDENRELFAVPGRIYAERSKGVNLLIQRSEARLTLTPNDVLASLGLEPLAKNAVLPELTDSEQAVYNALSGDPLHIETLAERTNITVQDLLATLLELEFKGIVRQLAGKQFMRLP